MGLVKINRGQGGPLRQIQLHHRNPIRPLSLKVRCERIGIELQPLTTIQSSSFSQKPRFELKVSKFDLNGIISDFDLTSELQPKNQDSIEPFVLVLGGDCVRERHGERGGISEMCGRKSNFFCIIGHSEGN
ncbi:unnamed protein product [Linum trigynum]|uniref:Uncharacterized protein n=1 Tax=Linum trigynum TaxID=586398 RepID=A0AAV2E3I3_9ROSI